MIFDTDKALLKRYRHITAALIVYSIGYFTPLAALQAIKDFKNNQPNFCEWYLDIAWKRGLNIVTALTSNLHLSSSTKTLPVTNRSAQAGFDWRFAHAKDR